MPALTVVVHPLFTRWGPRERLRCAPASPPRAPRALVPPSQAIRCMDSVRAAMGARAKVRPPPSNPPPCPRAQTTPATLPVRSRVPLPPPTRIRFAPSQRPLQLESPQQQRRSLLSAGLRGRRRARTAGGHLRRPRRPRLHHAGRGRGPHQRVPRPRLRAHRHRRLRRQGQRQAGAGQVPLMSSFFSPWSCTLFPFPPSHSLPHPFKSTFSHRNVHDAT